MNNWTLHHADCRDIFPTIPNASIHAANRRRGGIQKRFAYPIYASKIHPVDRFPLPVDTFPRRQARKCAAALFGDGPAILDRIGQSCCIFSNWTIISIFDVGKREG